jgi:hypothetical protein
MGKVGDMRYSELPINKDPKSMKCGDEEPDPPKKARKP